MNCSSLESKRPENYWAHFASPPRRDRLEEMLVRPWSGVICNIQCTSRKGGRDGPGGLEILDFFRVFNPESVQLMRGGSGGSHLGMAIIQFRNDLEGFSDAVAFEKYFWERRHLREDWRANQGEGVDGSLYGWLARGEDYHTAAFSKYLQATGELVELQSITQQMEEAHEQMLAEALAEKKKEVEYLSEKLDEANQGVQNEKNKTAIWKQDASVSSEDWNQQLNHANAAMKTMQKSCEKQQELSDSMQKVVNERNSEVARLQASCNKFEGEVAESHHFVEHLNSELAITTLKCQNFEIAAQKVQEQLEESKNELEKWMKNAEKLIRLGKRSDKRRDVAEERADQYIRDLQNARRQLENEKHKIEAKECIVCMTEFGVESDQQRSHYRDCHHANVCYGCSSKLWKSKKRKCPSCNTPATERPGRLPAKIFL